MPLRSISPILLIALAVVLVCGGFMWASARKNRTTRPPGQLYIDGQTQAALPNSPITTTSTSIPIKAGSTTTIILDGNEYQLVVTQTDPANQALTFTTAYSKSLSETAQAAIQAILGTAEHPKEWVVKANDPLWFTSQVLGTSTKYSLSFTGL